MTSYAESQDIYRDASFAVEPRYQLTEHEVASLTADLLHDQHDAIPADMPFVCMRVKGTSPYANIARHIEGKIFTEELHDDPERMAADYAPYEASSYFFIVLDVEKSMPTGMLRIIEDGPNGFMTLQELTTHVNPGDTKPQVFFHYDTFYDSFTDEATKNGDRGIEIRPDNTWEVGTIAVLPEYRRGANSSQDQAMISYIVSGLLYRALYAGAVDNNVEGFVSLIDPDALKTLRALGIPFDDIPGAGSMKYEDGSEFYPCRAVVGDFDVRMRNFAAQKVQDAPTEKDRNRAAGKQSMIDVLLTGYGLDDMMAFRHNNIAINSVH